MDGTDTTSASRSHHPLNLIGLSSAPLTLAEITENTCWIRNELEPSVAKHGPDSLSTDSVLELHTFLHKLGRVPVGRDNNQPSDLVITPQQLRLTRIHLALLHLQGLATRWPGKIVGLCETVIAKWESVFGDLTLIKPLLYEPGGRLAGLAESAALSRSALLIKWLSDPNSLVNPLRALEFGHLEFEPGQWWIHPLFAFHDGIISSPDPSGGITADNDGAYAILATEYDEVWHKEFPDVAEDTFRYRCKRKETFKFRLMASILQPKPSVRVLRSHTLHSHLRPIVGVRYEGLYRVIGFGSLHANGETVWEATLEREADQAPMKDICKRPTAEEEEDYHEYVELRNNAMQKTTSRRLSAALMAGSQEPSVDQGRPSPCNPLETGDIAAPLRHRPAITGSMTGRILEQEPREKSIASTESSRVGPSVSFRTICTPQLEAVNSRLFEYQREQRLQESKASGLGVSPKQSIPLDGASADTFRQQVSESEDQGICAPRRRRSINAGFTCEQDHANYLRPSTQWLSLYRSRSGSDIAKHVAGCYRRKDSGFCLTNTTVENTPFGLDGVLELGDSCTLDHAHLDHLAQGIKSLTGIVSRGNVIGKSYLNDILAIRATVERWTRQDALKSGFVSVSLRSIDADLLEVIANTNPIEDGDSKSLYDFASALRIYARNCPHGALRICLEARAEQEEELKEKLDESSGAMSEEGLVALPSEKFSQEDSRGGSRMWRRRGAFSE